MTRVDDCRLGLWRLPMIVYATTRREQICRVNIDQIVDAHRDMEAGTVGGKAVVLL